MRTSFYSSTQRTRWGALAWIVGTIQFFAVQLIADLRWPTGYSWSANNISDLGNLRCQNFDPDHLRYICSPLHSMVNVSFIAEGVLLLIGTLLIGNLWQHASSAKAARVLLAAAAAGWILVGLFPADKNLNMHVLGAVLIFFLGNAALLGASRGLTNILYRSLRIASLCLGILGLTAAVLFLRRNYLGLGMGGMERFAVFGLQLWTFAVGLTLTRTSVH